MTTPPGNPHPGPGSPGAAEPVAPYGAQPQSNAPTVLGIIGVVCAVLCSPAGIMIGLVGTTTARELGQSTRLPRVAWILGVVMLAFLVVANIVRYLA